MAEQQNASGRRSRLLSSKSGRKTPLERILSARAYTAFTVIVEIKGTGVVGFETFYEENRRGINEAITGAVFDPSTSDPEVKEITYRDKTIRVEMLYRLDESLLSFEKNFEDRKTKIREEVKKFGIYGVLDFSIVNQKHLQRKMEEIRLVERALVKGGRGMSGMHEKVLLRKWNYITRDLDVSKILSRLLSKDIFGTDDKDMIEKKASRKEKSDSLLEILREKDPDAFDDFVEILGEIQMFLAFALLQEERKEYKKEQNALISSLKNSMKARCDIYDMKTALEKSFEEERENMETKIRNLEKELNERKAMGKRGVNNCSSQDDPMGIIVGVPGEPKNERENQLELVEISTVIQEGCKKLQNEVTEKCSAIIGMIVHKEECRVKELSGEVKRLEEEHNNLRDEIKERGDEAIECNLKLEAEREEKAGLEQSYKQTLKENNQLQKRNQNLQAESLEAKRAMEGLKFNLEEARKKTKEQSIELAELKDPIRRAKLHLINFEKMQRIKEENKEYRKQKGSLTNEIKRLRSQVEHEIKSHMATDVKLKEVSRLHKQAKKRLKDMQSLKSPSTLPAVGLGTMKKKPNKRD